MALLWVHLLPTFLSDITKLCFSKESTNLVCIIDTSMIPLQFLTTKTEFFSHLNSLHPSLCFTLEKECNRTLTFLDILVEKNGHEFVTSIYRKPTFTGQYIRWNSFCPMKQKTNLMSTLVYKALVICSESTLQNKLSNIRSVLINNVFPKAVINTVITKKINQFRRPTQFGPKKCPVYFYLP